MKRNKLFVFTLASLFLLSFFAVFIQIPEVQAATLTFSASTNDGYIHRSGTDYQIVHDASTGTNIFAENEFVSIGQFWTTYYLIGRGFLFFDSSALPDGAIIVSANLSLYIKTDLSDTDFDVTIQKGMPAYPHDPLEVGDYYYQYYSGDDGGSRNTGNGLSAGSYWNISLSETGLTWIQKDGTTKLCLRSSRDINANIPTEYEYISFWSAEYGAAYVAKLYVEYSIPQTYSTLTVSSSPEINAKFSVNATSYKTLSYVEVQDTTIATLVAESAKIYGGEGWLFDRWLVNSTTYYTQTINLNITGDTNIKIYYSLLGNLYHFHGPFDEETGVLLNENVTVTVYYDVGGYPPYSFSFNGSWVYPTSPRAQYFRFNFSDNSTREYWVDPSEAVLPIYIFKGDTTPYTINFLDTTGILKTYPYVTIKRYVNGTLYTIEKRRVDAYNSIIANLIMTRTYQIILGNEQTTYVFGDFLATAQTAVQLILRGVDFPKETLFIQKYIRIYGYRNVTGGYLDYLVIYYEDTKQATSSVDVYIYHGDGSLVYSINIPANSFPLEWYGAAHGVNYQVTVIIHHNKYGDVTWKQYFPGGMSEPPWSLAFLGDWNFDSAFLIPALLILCAAGSFSKLNAEVGAFLMVITAIILTWMGWIPIPAGMLVAAITLAILMALIYAKRRVTVY